jgi:hypothetical protein
VQLTCTNDGMQTLWMKERALVMRWCKTAGASSGVSLQVFLSCIFLINLHFSPLLTAIPDSGNKDDQTLAMPTRTPCFRDSESSSFSYVNFPSLSFHQIILCIQMCSLAAYPSPLCSFILTSIFPNSKSVYVVIVLQSNFIYCSGLRTWVEMNQKSKIQNTQATALPHCLIFCGWKTLQPDFIDCKLFYFMYWFSFLEFYLWGKFFLFFVSSQVIVIPTTIVTILREEVLILTLARKLKLLLIFY